MTKSHFVLRLHPEFSLKLTKSLWRFHFHFPDIVSSGLDLILNFYCFGFQIISACLNKIKISWPSCLSIVSDCPFLYKILAGLNRELVSKTFLYKTTFIPNLFFLVIFGDVFGPRIMTAIDLIWLLLNRLIWLWRGKKVEWCLAGFPYLKHLVLTVMIFWFTLGAKVKIRTNWTLKSYASNRLYATNRADESIVYLFCLKIVLFLQEFWNQYSELLSAK